MNDFINYIWNNKTGRQLRIDQIMAFPLPAMEVTT